MNLYEEGQTAKHTSQTPSPTEGWTALDVGSKQAAVIIHSPYLWECSENTEWLHCPTSWRVWNSEQMQLRQTKIWG